MREMFQFLIGRLKTLRAVYDYLLGTGFQFLIGRLKTGLGSGLTSGGAGFNSS